MTQPVKMTHAASNAAAAAIRVKLSIRLETIRRILAALIYDVEIGLLRQSWLVMYWSIWSVVEMALEFIS